MTARHLLEQKGPNVWTIDPDATVFDALAKMAEKDIGSLVVMDGEKLIGIVTERHYSRNVILKGKTSPTTLVRDIMERNVIRVGPEQSRLGKPTRRQRNISPMPPATTGKPPSITRPEVMRRRHTTPIQREPISFTAEVTLKRP